MISNKDLKTFTDGQRDKPHALHRVEAAAELGMFYANGRIWDGKRGNITGAVYHPYMEAGETEHDLWQYPRIIHGIPHNVMCVANTIFNGLSFREDQSVYKDWPMRFYNALPGNKRISRVPDQLIYNMIADEKWIAEYADEKGAHLVGLMASIFVLRIEGIECGPRLMDIYHTHIHKLHRSRYMSIGSNESKLQNYPYGAVKALCDIVSNPGGAIDYFLNISTRGRARHEDKDPAKMWDLVADEFITLLGKVE